MANNGNEWLLMASSGKLLQTISNGKNSQIMSNHDN